MKKKRTNDVHTAKGINWRIAYLLVLGVNTICLFILLVFFIAYIPAMMMGFFPHIPSYFLSPFILNVFFFSVYLYKTHGGIVGRLVALGILGFSILIVFNVISAYIVI